MKKRIGTRNYDTDSSRVIAKNGVVTLYQKRTNTKEFFLCDGEIITPLEDEKAREFIEMTGIDIIEQPESSRTYDRNGNYNIWIAADVYDALHPVSVREHKSISDVIREILRKVGLM